MDGYFRRFPSPGRGHHGQRSLRGRPPRHSVPPAWQSQYQNPPYSRHPAPAISRRHMHTNEDIVNTRKTLKITANLAELQRPRSNSRDVFKRLGKPVDQSPKASLHETSEMKAAYLQHKEKLKQKQEQSAAQEGQVTTEDEPPSDSNKSVDKTDKEENERPCSIQKKDAAKSDNNGALKDLSLLAHYLLHRRTLKSKQDSDNASEDNDETTTKPEAATKGSDEVVDVDSVVDMDVSEATDSTADEAVKKQVEVEVEVDTNKAVDETTKSGGRLVEKDNSEGSRHLLITTHFDKKTDKKDTADAEIPPENRSNDPDATWFCVVCNEDVTGEKITHYREENHKKNKKLARPHCDVCDQWFNRPCQLIQHINSKEHKDKNKKVRSADNADLPRAEDATETKHQNSDAENSSIPNTSAAPSSESFSTTEDQQKDNAKAPASILDMRNDHQTSKFPRPAEGDQSLNETTAKDLPHIIPVAGYYCEVCCDFFFDEASTIKHCRTNQHRQKIKNENGDSSDNQRAGTSSAASPNSAGKPGRRRKSTTPVRPLALQKKVKIASPGGAPVLSPKSNLGVPRKTITTDQRGTRNSVPGLTSPKKAAAPPSAQKDEVPKPLSRSYVIPKRNKVS